MRKIRTFFIIFFVLILLCAVAASFADSSPEEPESVGVLSKKNEAVSVNSGTSEASGADESTENAVNSGAESKNSSSAEDITQSADSGVSGDAVSSVCSGASGIAVQSVASGASGAAAFSAASGASGDTTLSIDSGASGAASISAASGASSDTTLSIDSGASEDNVISEGSGTSENAGRPAAFDLSQVPAYSGSPVAVVNDNIPFFTADDLTTEPFEIYSSLDSLGRCGTAFANVCEELMPTEPRGDIGMIRPSGWHTVKYNGIIDGNYLYNRCHLIAYELAGENANEKNLITGTRYMNTEGMLPYENDTKDYVIRTGHHVLYRVTPVFEGDNLVASGVLMEAHSVEDNDFYFCIYCYNVQPGIKINYATGDSEPDGTIVASSGVNQADGIYTDSVQAGAVSPGRNDAVQSADKTAKTYIVNKNTKKFHFPECSSADDIKPKNKEVFTGDRQTLIDRGYDPCKRCKP